MSNSEGILLFTSDSSGAGTGEYVQKAFADIALPATNNTGFSSTVARNPLNNFFGNDAQPRYMAKTLYIKDLLRIEDKTKWINNEPTFEIIWHETFTSARGYCWGSVALGGTTENRYLNFSRVTEGVGIGGIIRRVMWLIKPRVSGGLQLTNKVDGVSLGVFDLFDSPTLGSNSVRFNAFAHATTNETHDIHDYQIVLPAGQLPGNVTVYGAVVYYEIPASGIDVAAGTVFVDKSTATSLGASLAFPSGFTSFLGGKASVVMGQGSVGFTFSPVPEVFAAGTVGTNATNQLTVPTGLGASFPAGTGLYIAQGATQFLGVVTSVSGDILTMAQTLPFGVSHVLRSLFHAGYTYSLSASLIEKSFEFQSAVQAPLIGTTGNPNLDAGVFSFNDASLKYKLWGYSLGFVPGSSLSANLSGATTGLQLKSGFLQIDGNYSALEFEFMAGQSASLKATLVIDGIANVAFNEAPGGPGLFRRLVLKDAGVGWHNVRMTDAGGTQIAITRIIGYETKGYNGPTLGILAEIPVNSTLILRDSISATSTAYGGVQRLYGDNLWFYQGWTRSAVAPAGDVPGGIKYSATSVNSILQFQYFGTRFALLSSQFTGQSFSVTVNGIPDGSTCNVWLGTGLTLGFQSVVVTDLDGGALQINAVDYVCPVGQPISKLNYIPDYSPGAMRFFETLEEPANTKPGDIWEQDKDKAVAFQRLFGGWQRLNANNPMCFYGSTLTQSLSNGVAVPSSYNNLVFDPFGMVTTGTSMFLTVPSDGNYQFIASRAWDATAGGSKFLAIRKLPATGGLNFPNDFMVAQIVNPSAIGHLTAGTIVIPNLKKGNQLMMLMQQDTGGALSTDPDPTKNFFQCMRIGP